MKMNKEMNSNTAISVTKIIKSQNDKLEKLINKTDNFYVGWIENCPDNKIFVSFRGSVPIYINKEYYLFQRIEINQYERQDISEPKDKIKKSSKELLLELLDKIKIKRIYDEDGQNGIFTKVEKTKNSLEDSAYCYVNPFIPNGYWENHILETRYIEII